MRLVSDRTGQPVCGQCTAAKRPLARMKGLLGTDGLEAGHGLLLPRTRSIHTFFMRFPIDAIFLDRDMRVLSLRANLKPWRMAASRRAKYVLELPAGECERHEIVAGDVLMMQETDV
jgi:uncharacterized protein